MANSMYALPSDELAASVTPTLVEGTADSGYPLSNLYDGFADTVFRPTSTAAFEIQWDFGSARLFGIAALLGSLTLDAGSAVTLYVTATAYPGAPTGGETYAVTIPALREDGMRNQPYVDLSASAAKRYVRLRVPAQTAIAAIGEFKVSGTKRSLTRNVETYLDYVDRRPVIDQVSDTGAVRSFDWGVTTRRLGITSWQLHAAALAEFYTLLRSVKGHLTPFLFILDPSAAPQDARLVRFGSEPVVRQIGPALWNTSCVLDEVSGGVPA